MTTQDTKDQKLPCIWRDGCDRQDTCQRAGCCQGLARNREDSEPFGLSPETLQMLEDAEYEDQP